MTDDREPRSSEEMLRDVEEWLKDDQSIEEKAETPLSVPPSSVPSKVPARDAADRFCPTCGVKTFTGYECMACVRARPQKVSWWKGPPPPKPEVVTDRREAMWVIVRDVGTAVVWLLVLLGSLYLKWRPGSIPSGLVIGLVILAGVLIVVARVFSFAQELVQRYGEPLGKRWRAVRADRKRRKGHRLEDALEAFGWDRRWAYPVRGFWMVTSFVVFWPSFG